MISDFTEILHSFAFKMLLSLKQVRLTIIPNKGVVKIFEFYAVIRTISRKNRKNRKIRIFHLKKTETEIEKTETEMETLNPSVRYDFVQLSLYEALHNLDFKSTFGRTRFEILYIEIILINHAL